MIFVTTGTQEPFDRLIKTVDAIVPQLNGEEVIAQVSGSDYKVENMESLDFIKPTLFEQYFRDARLIISHAGMGTVISALEKQKPIIVMPRLTKFGEHRNEHQLATAKKLEKLNYVHVVYDEAELEQKIKSVLANPEPLHKLGKFASGQLISSLSNFINSVER